jgi:hypothetical protein
MSAARRGGAAHLAEDRGDAAPVRVDLHGGPRVARAAGVLRFDADEVRVAGREC